MRRIDRVAIIGHRVAVTRAWRRLARLCVLSSGILVAISAAAADDGALARKLYRIIDGKVDARTYDGFRRYHAGCNHCHGQDGLGSTFGVSLVERLPDIEAFRRVVLDGKSGTSSVMKGFAADPNIAPHVDDIFAYLQARADGVLGRGRPLRLEH
jgi:mono/diheme cytochrome c family protein